MPNVSVFDVTGKKVSDIDLADGIFGIEPNTSAMHLVVVNYLANQRQGTQSTLTRAEVSGGGKKPWRQKGTGRARQGSIRAPQWVGGGVALGPKPRSYRFSINKKMKKVAIKSALSAKYAAYEIYVVEDLAVEEIKTAKMAALLKGLEVDKKALIVTAEADEKVYKSARNIKGVDTTFVGAINTYEVLGHTKCIITKDAALKLEEVLA